MARRAQGGRGRANLLRPAEEYGGGGVDSLVTTVAILEELAWGCSAMAGCIGGGSFFAGPIVALGTPGAEGALAAAAVLARPTPSSARSRPPSRTRAPMPPR